MDVAVTKLEAQKAVESLRQAVPRRLTYTTALETIEQSLREGSELQTFEVLGAGVVNLNRNFYKNIHFDPEHLAKIESLVKETDWRAFRRRELSSLSDNDQPQVVKLFSQFQKTLGASGASKALNLLAPTFFPIWIISSAGAFGIPLQQLKNDEKPDKYWEYMKSSQPLYEQLKEHLPDQKREMILMYLHERNFRKFCPQPRGTPIF